MGRLKSWPAGIVTQVGGFSESLWLMDQHGIIIKRLVSFPGNILVHNVQVQETSLEVVLQNQLVSFDLRPERASVRFCRNWIIRNESVGSLELKNVASILGDSAGDRGKGRPKPRDVLEKAEDSCLESEPRLRSNRMEMLDGMEVISNKFSLESLGLVQDISVFERDSVAILSKTEKSTRLLTFKISELDLQFHARKDKLNQMVLEARDSQLAGEDTLPDVMGLEALVHNVRDRQLEGAEFVLALKEAFLVGFGGRLVLFSKDMVSKKSWNFESKISSVCPVAFAVGSEVSLLGLVSAPNQRTLTTGSEGAIPAWEGDLITSPVFK